MNIKELRKKLLLTQQEFATILGISPTIVAWWERGLSKPNLKNLRKIKDLCEKNGLEFEKYYK